MFTYTVAEMHIATRRPAGHRVPTGHIGVHKNKMDFGLQDFFIE